MLLYGRMYRNRFLNDSSEMFLNQQFEMFTRVKQPGPLVFTQQIVKLRLQQRTKQFSRQGKEKEQSSLHPQGQQHSATCQSQVSV